MGLLLFATIGLFGAGRALGLDAVVERLEFVKQRPRLKYLLG
jgi:thiosulfate dehydrogenase [quinone] large subunit